MSPDSLALCWYRAKLSARESGTRLVLYQSHRAPPTAFANQKLRTWLSKVRESGGRDMLNRGEQHHTFSIPVPES